MANSRLERIGTIYTRVNSLIKGKAWTLDDVPLWYNIYKAFPPKLEPRYDRVVPNVEIKDIFYKEDIIRAKFQKDYSKFLRFDLLKNGTPSSTQKFIAIYNDLEKSGGAGEDLYEKAVEIFKVQNPNFRETKNRSLSNAPEDTSKTSKSKKLDIDFNELLEKP